MQGIIFRRDRKWLLSLALIIAMLTMTIASLLQTSLVYAAAPTGSSAVMQNSTQTTVDIVVTGTDFDHFASSGTATGDATDRAAISYNSQNPTAAVIGGATTMTLTFPIATGTGKSGGALVINANTVEDSGSTGNLEISIADGSITDSAKPILSSVVLSSSSNLNRVTFNYTELMSITDGASSTSLGDMTTAGTITGLGSFATTGDATVPTTLNTVGGNGTTALYVDLAAQSGGSITTTASPGTEIAGVVTPTASASVVDANSNQVETSVTPTASGGGSWDLTRPTITSATLADADADGRVDRCTLVLDSAMRDSNVTDADATLGGNAGTFTTGTANDATNVFNVTSDDLSVNTSATAASFLYSASTTSITDLAGNLVDTATDGAIAADDVVEADGAAPVVASVSPADAATGSSTSNGVVVTFSEAMDTTFAYGTEYSSTPNPGNWSAAWTVGNTVVTLSHAAFAALTSYNIVLDEAEIDAAAGTPTTLVTTGPEDGDWTFTTGSVSGSSSSGDTGPRVNTYDITLTYPTASGLELTPGDVETLTWSTDGTGSINFISLYYSTDGGATYTAIEENISNTGSYSWTVPDVDTSNGIVKVVGTDLVDELDSDISDYMFTILGTSTEDTTEDTSDEVTAPETGETGVSPITGEEEAISEVNAGDYIRGASYDTVYYIDSDMERHPFLDAQTYFTWRDSFAGIETVTDATLTTLTLGTAMLPKPGVVLVKIQSDPKVYAIEENLSDAYSPYLRHITSEDLAIEIYGEDWADYVIDIQPTLFPYFSDGDDVNAAGDITVDLDAMKTRAAVNS